MLNHLAGGAFAVAPVCLRRGCLPACPAAFGKGVGGGERGSVPHRVPDRVRNLGERNLRIQLAEFGAFPAEAERGGFLPGKLLPQLCQLFAEL